MGGDCLCHVGSYGPVLESGVELLLAKYGRRPPVTDVGPFMGGFSIIKNHSVKVIVNLAR